MWNFLVLGPINSSARLRLNLKPELDVPAFSTPKIHLNLDLEKLAIGISKAQYHDIIALAESLTRMARGVPYRKYRPNLDVYKGHAKEWWQFAFKCVLEQVRQYRRNWDWNHIRRHRQMCKEYGKMYKTKLQSKKLPANFQTRLTELEKELDAFNIIIIRQSVELEVARVGTPPESDRWWFTAWWGSKPKQESKGATDAAAIGKKLVCSYKTCVKRKVNMEKCLIGEAVIIMRKARSDY